MKKEIYFADANLEYSQYVEQFFVKYWPAYQLRRFDNLSTMFRKLVRACGPSPDTTLPSLIICNYQVGPLTADHLTGLLRQKINGKPTLLSHLPVMIFIEQSRQHEAGRCKRDGALVAERPVKFKDLKNCIDHLMQQVPSLS